MMDDCGGVRTVHGGHAGPHCLLNLVLDRVVEQIPYSLVDVKPHGRTGKYCVLQPRCNRHSLIVAGDNRGQWHCRDDANPCHYQQLK